MTKLTPEDVNNAYKHGMLVLGDCLDTLYQLPRNSVDLIYLDPPFATGKQWDGPWEELDNKIIKDIDDAWKYGIYGYISYMKPRLQACYYVLKSSGSLYLHCDHNASHYLKIEMDKIFGEGNAQKGMKNFITQITWKRAGIKGNSNVFGNNSDYLLFYSKNRQDPKFKFNTQYGEYKESTLKEFKYNDNDGRGPYKSTDLSAPGIGYKYELGLGEKMPKRGYGWTKTTMMEKIEDNRVIIRPGKVPRQKRYINESDGVPYDNIWIDINNVKNAKYSTQKPIELMRRIINTSSNRGDVVLDPFCGSGPFIKEAIDSGRKPIGIDMSIKGISQTQSKLFAPAVEMHGATEEEIRKFIDDNNLDSDQEEEYQRLMNMQNDPNDKLFEINICTMWGGIPNYKKGKDRGLDGHKYRDGKKIGLQVKKTKITGPDYRQFKNDLREQGCVAGTMISDIINGGAETDCKKDGCNQDTSHYIHINLKTIKQLIKDSMFNDVKELVSPTPQISKYMKIKENNSF